MERKRCGPAFRSFGTCNGFYLTFTPHGRAHLSAFSMVALHPSVMSRDASLDMVHSIITSSSRQHSTTSAVQQQSVHAMTAPKQQLSNQRLLEHSNHTSGVDDAATVHSKDNMAALKLLQMKQQQQQQQLQLQQIQQHQHRQRLFADLIASASRRNGGSGKNQDGSTNRVQMTPTQGMPMLTGMAAQPALASARAAAGAAAPTTTTLWSALTNQQGVGHFRGLRPAPNATSNSTHDSSSSNNLVVPVAVSRALSSNVNQYLQRRHHQQQVQFQQRFQNLLAAKTTQSQSVLPVATAPHSQNPMMVPSRLGPHGPQDTNHQHAARLALFAAAAARQAHAIPPALPVTLYRPSDACKLSRMQALLRQHVQLFSASSDDVETHVRGRSKPIALHQVGIRCKHCTHVHILQRAKGSAYFPTSVWGIYQASQNMGTTHFVSGQCASMPQDVKDEFAQLAAAKSSSKSTTTASSSSSSTSADGDCDVPPPADGDNVNQVVIVRSQSARQVFRCRSSLLGPIGHVHGPGRYRRGCLFHSHLAPRRQVD
jgi:hypothetical protein